MVSTSRVPATNMEGNGYQRNQRNSDLPAFPLPAGKNDPLRPSRRGVRMI